MLKSMTGFGRATYEADGYVITVEIKSVNHKFFEFSCRIPRQYAFLEDKLKAYVNSRISRGKVDCFVTVEALEADNTEVAVNHSLAGAYIDALREISEGYGLREDFGAYSIAHFPDVLVVRKSDEDEDKLWNIAEKAAEGAVDRFIEMRETEGAEMREDILSRLAFILETVSFIEERSPETVRIYNQKLIDRVHMLLGDASLDESRILQEVAIYADKVAVAEETVRLRSHISQFKKILDCGEPVGRKLDFLVQEMNREANTIASKACDVDIASKVVDVKAEIEKIREQIQNIE